MYLIYKGVTGQLRSHTPYAHLQSETSSLLTKGTEEKRRGADGNEEFKVMACVPEDETNAANVEPKVLHPDLQHIQAKMKFPMRWCSL